MIAFTVRQRVRVIERVDENYGRTGIIIYIHQDTQTATVRFDDNGEKLGYLLDDDELEAID